MKRKLQEYFSAMYLNTEIEILRPHEDLVLFEKIKRAVYPKIFSVWWGQKQDEYKGPLLASLPFTYVDWKTAEMLRNGNFKFEELSDDQIQKLCLNICPGLMTFPQFCAQNGESMHHFVNKLLDKIDNDEDQFIVPFARNIWGKTSLHILADLDNKKQANNILRVLGQSPTHHHSMDISDIIGWLVAQNLPEVGTYFDSRLIENSQTRSIKTGDLKEKGKMLTTSKITMNEEKIRKAVFNEQESAAEGRVIVTILDLPRLHDFNERTADDFFVTLAEEAEIELFANKSM